MLAKHEKYLTTSQVTILNNIYLRDWFVNDGDYFLLNLSEYY